MSAVLLSEKIVRGSLHVHQWKELQAHWNHSHLTVSCPAVKMNKLDLYVSTWIYLKIVR